MKTDSEEQHNRMASFLADLPSTNPLHFSQLPEKDLKSCDGVKAVKTAFHVPRRDDEKQIVNDKKPYILRFLEKQWKVRTPFPKKNSVSLIVSFRFVVCLTPTSGYKCLARDEQGEKRFSENEKGESGSYEEACEMRCTINFVRSKNQKN
ncbi:hypothetical protein Q1695_009462 [Nippostrongylus brasiliensis]|nr:hypothetical protein Q1695_009462 [Nippostrongylus brasiliensis]